MESPYRGLQVEECTESMMERSGHPCKGTGESAEKGTRCRCHLSLEEQGTTVPSKA